jgi:hypothetical protein
MPMNDMERWYIEYHPRLGLNINVTAIIESQLEALGTLAPAAYNVPEELLEAMENPPCRSLEKAMDTMGKLDGLLDDIEENLADTVSGGISFQDYLSSREENGDPDVKRAWEEHQGKNLDGKLEGELYPVLLEARKNLADKVMLLNKEVLVGDIEYDKVDDICKQEKQKVEDILKNDVAKSDPAVLAELKMNNELTDAISDAVDDIAAFVDEAEELLNMNVDDIFEGVDEVVSHLADAKPDDLTRLSTLAEIGFAKQAEESEAIKDRMDLVGESNTLLHEEIAKFRTLKADAGKIMEWFESIDTNYDSSPITNIIEDNMESVDDVLDGYDDVLLDMHKGNEMQKMQFEDLTQVLYSKETYRQTTSLTKNMKKHYDKSDKNKEKQVARFTQNMGYKKRKKPAKKSSSKKPSLIRGAKR